MTSHRSIPAYEALQASMANPLARWQGRAEENRIEPECWPVIQPTFAFAPGCAVFTVGSCFARAIEAYLDRRGFRIPHMDRADPRAPLAAHAYLNKYAPPSIYQELKWAFDILQRDDVVTRSDVEPLFFRRADGRVIDLHLLSFDPVTENHAFERRQAVYRVFREAFSADVVIMTLGLIEAWRDLETGLFVIQMPHFLRRRSDLQRFEFVRLGFAEALGSVRQSIDLLASVGAPKKFLVTTSPIPLGRTFTSDDVIVANTYSKAVLRAVAGQIADERADVDYFPSYESVILTKQAHVWDDDLVHVVSSFSDKIMAHVLDAYVVRSTEPAPNLDADVATFALLVEARDQEAALALYDRLKDAPSLLDDVVFQSAAAALHARCSRLDVALAHARKGWDLATDTPRLTLVLEAYRMAGRHGDANNVLADMVDRLRTFPHGIGVEADRLDQVGLAADAIRLVEMGWRLGIANASALRGLSRRYVASDRGGDAVAALRAAVAIDDTDAFTQFQLGRLLLDHGAPEQALPHLRAALALEPDAAERRYFLASALERLSRLAEAERELRRNLQDAVDRVRARQMLDRFLLRTRDANVARRFVGDEEKSGASD